MKHLNNPESVPIEPIRTKMNPEVIEPIENEMHEASADDPEEWEPEGSADAPKKRRKVRMREKHIQKVRESINGHDIRYRGPLSYRHLRIIAWVLLGFSLCGTILSLVYRYIPNLLPIVGQLGDVFSTLWQHAVPLFMLANFAVILRTKEKYGHTILIYAAFSAAVYAGFLLLVERYIKGSLAVLLQDAGSAKEMVNGIFLSVFTTGFCSFNIFIDLLLYTILTFFLYCRPKHVFTGKKLIVFRLFTLVPIAYEVASIVLKFRAMLGLITLPVWTWPLLTTKPPAIFAVFLALALYIKRRERLFTASGFTHEEYRLFLNTRRNSLNVSLFTAVVFILAAIVDALLMVILSAVLAVSQNGANATEQMYRSTFDLLQKIGIGNGIQLMGFAPVVLLYSYSKTYKNRTADLLIPIFGMGFIVLLVLEFLYQLIRLAPTLM